MVRHAQEGDSLILRASHNEAFEGRAHVIIPFVPRKNENLTDGQQSYNVLVLRVPGLEEGVMFGGKAL